MLTSTKPEPDFSKECAGKRISHLLFSTHPYHPGSREWFCASTRCPMILATVNLFIHRSDILYLAISQGPENGPSSGSIVPGLCRVLDMDFRKFPFSRH
jgi:hypothetical protein